MFIRVKTTPNSPRKSVQICENKRIGDKVSQKIVRYVGIAMDDNELEQMKHMAAEIIAKMQSAANGDLLDLFEPNDQDSLLERKVESIKLGRKKRKSIADILPVEDVRLSDIVEEKRVIEGVQEIAGGLFDYLGFDKVIPGKRHADILKNLVLLRAFDPCSKLRTSEILARDYDLDNSVDSIYRVLDKVHDNIDNIKSVVFGCTKSLFPDKVNMVLFDVTTLYFESTDADELRDYGYSKDQKFNQTQVVLALATNEHGLPFGYELFSGNKAEVSTLLEAINKWKTLFTIEAITIIADRAMCSRDNLAALDANGINYVVAMPLRKALKSNARQTLLEDFADCEQRCVKEYEHEGRRLIVSYCPDRAKKDRKDRDKIITKLQVKLKRGRIKNLVSNRGYLKYISDENTATVSVNDAKILEDSRWDGIHAIITSDKATSATEILASYRRLWVIEESFRINKNNLQMRPIYHYKPERIKAHIAVCYMAFALIRHLQYRIKLAQVEMSIDTIRRELVSVQSSILVHKKTGDYYRLPGRMSNEARKIYKAFAIERRCDASIYLKN